MLQLTLSRNVYLLGSVSLFKVTEIILTLVAVSIEKKKCLYFSKKKKSISCFQKTVQAIRLPPL